MTLLKHQSDNGRMRILAAMTALATVAVYIPALWNNFVNWDDALYVYENSNIRSLNIKFLKWAFFNSFAGNWHPLTLLSHAIDYALWGLDPFGHHLTNVVLHGLNSMLVVLLVHRLLAAAKGAAVHAEPRVEGLTEKGIGAAAVITGLLFGLHPLHVESVAWISERKDVLYAFFYLLSLLMYIRYAVSRNRDNASGSPLTFLSDRRYLGALGLFSLSLLSKPMAVTLSAVLLLLDWLPLRRFVTQGWRRVFAEKVPFFVLSVFAGIVAIVTQHGSDAVATLEELPLLTRILVSSGALIAYLGKMVYPAVLLPHYPYPRDVSLRSPAFFIPLIAVVVITITCIAISKKHRLWAAVWGYYVVTLLPVIGIIQVGEQSMADRYTYLPGLGLFLLAGLGAARAYDSSLFTRHPLGRKLLFLVPAALLLCVLSYKTVTQISVWQNGGTLWTHEIRNDPFYAPGYTYRGDYYTEAGRYQEAMQDIEHAVSLTPDYPDPYYYRGVVYMKEGYFIDAVISFGQAITRTFTPDSRYYQSRGEAYARLGKYEEAMKDYSEAVKLAPDLPDIYYNRGEVYARLGRYNEAVLDYTRAIDLSPSPPAGYYYERSSAYRNLGREEEAQKDLARFSNL